MLNYVSIPNLLPIKDKMSDSLQIKKFSDIDINEPFFDSLKEDYREFSHWFK